VANLKQSKKRIKQSARNNRRNVSLRSMFRTYVKKVVLAIKTGDKSAAEAAYKAAVPVIDKMITKGIIHKNKAARHKSRLATQINAMGKSEAK
jgi:small subunit ribosomal protein S20